VHTKPDIDDDLVAAAKEPARRKGPALIAGGFRPFPAREGVFSNNEQIDRLRDVEGV
jgi:hypothetical protein